MRNYGGWWPPVVPDSVLLADVAAGHVRWRLGKPRPAAVNHRTWGLCTIQIRRLQRLGWIELTPEAAEPFELTDAGVVELLAGWARPLEGTEVVA